MSSIVVFRNSPLGKQVLQESVNNTANISNNDAKNVRREIIIVRKKKSETPATVSVTSLLQGEPLGVVTKRPRLRESAPDDTRTAPSLSVARRNARERNRVRQVNDGFAALRKHIPDEVAAAFETANCNKLGPNKKLSKVETLRMAVEYIRNLETLLNIGHADKENGTQPSMESFPSPASSSPRDNSQERSYYMNSPALDDEELDEEDLDSSIHQLPQQHYVGLPSAESLLASTPHLYEEEDGIGQPMTPSSDLLSHEEVNPHMVENHYVGFPNSSEQFTVIPEQTYISDSEIQMSENDFEVKYADTMNQQIQIFDGAQVIPLETLNTNLILTHEAYKYEDDKPFNTEEYTDVELKKELPDIRVTPEDREQFEETLKWWQEKTKLVRQVSKVSSSNE